MQQGIREVITITFVNLRAERTRTETFKNNEIQILVLKNNYYLKNKTDTLGEECSIK